jgi:hypothetical protein
MIKMQPVEQFCFPMSYFWAQARGRVWLTAPHATANESRPENGLGNF